MLEAHIRYLAGFSRFAPSNIRAKQGQETLINFEDFVVLWRGIMVSSKTERKIMEAFIFYSPIVAAGILFLWCYLCYRRSVHRSSSSPQMRTARLVSNDNIPTCRFGLKKELREMLTIIVFKESLSMKDTQCSVCLGEYQAEDKLKQIPVCGHTFHMHCIDSWFRTHATCPLCRLPLLTSMASNQTPDNRAGETNFSHDTDSQSGGPQRGDPQQGQQASSPADLEESHSEISISVQVDCP